MERSVRLSRLLVLSLLALPAAAAAAWRSEGPFVANVSDVAVDATKPDTIYVATSAGGVWRSDDGGQTWTLPGDGMVSRDVRWIEVDLRDPATLWAGAGGAGESRLWRSTDRGKSWTAVKVDATSHALGQPIAFAASKPGTVFVPSTNLHYRSADGGRTWQSFRVPGQDAYTFAVDPKNPAVVWAGGRGEEHNLSRSQDGGKTWKPLGEGLEQEASIKLLRVSAAKPGTLYAVSGFGNLHRSTDGGATWTELEIGLHGTDDLYTLEIDPHDPRRLLLATEKGMRLSTDSGDTWRAAGAGTGTYLVRGIAFHPAKAGTVYAGTGGDGLFRSTDGGETFQPLGTGLAAGWTERLWAPASAAGPVFALLATGLFRMDGAGTWTEVRAPFSEDEPAKIDGVVFDRDSARKAWAHASSRWWRSEDAGRTFSPVEVKGPGLKDMMKGNTSGPQFQSLVQDPADPKVFYAGAWSNRDPGTAVFRTSDGGKKWQPAGNGLPGGSVKLLRSAALGTVFAACGDDGLYRTTDAGRGWTRVRPGALADLAVDPGHPERLYAATKEGLFRSADSGATWSRATQGLKGDEVEAVAVSRDGQVFAGTFDGVFRSADAGVTWKALNEGLANTDVRALAVSGGSPARLWAGFAGGSVFSTELP